MERWIEITQAMNAGTAKGIDPAATLASYDMNAADWGTAGGWWSQHFNANAIALLPEYNRLTEVYEAKFAAGDADADVEF